MPMRSFVPLKDVESVLPILSDIAILGGFSDRQLHEIFKYLEESVFKQGETVFQKGDEPTHIYIVKKERSISLSPNRRSFLKRKPWRPVTALAKPL